MISHKGVSFMPDLAKLIAELEGGSIDLANCISLHPDLSHEDQLLLAKAEQRWRFRRGDACNIEHYKNVVSWLAEDPKCQRELIAAEFALRLGSAPDHELLDQFLVRYCEWGTGLSDQLRGIARDFRRLEGKANQEPIAQTTKNETKAGSAKSREDLDLTGSFISPNTVGDARAGRYVFARLLGRGKFGAVYLAQDMELKRQVAVKVPNREALEAHVDVESYLVEAQTVAMLDHPHIVPIYDVGRTHDGSIFVVTKFINGCSLAEWIKTQPLDHHATAKLLEPIAEALHHAHQRRLIHRDIKPANILIEEATATPFVADFGLAVREEDYLQKGYISGTPAYMSPEQIRGEGHRLDGRSDLFSLGVVMYQMLTGHLPFQGRTREEVTQKITSVEPVAPSSIRQDTPIELERICLKLLRKRISERYANGRELAEDLRAWLAPRTSHGVATTYQRITPRGLRSFTAEDASYFLDLLPGPRNRDGLPESIAFWKERIEQRDPDLTFTVGLLYGPSGCGKSSLVKAGLIPHLAPEVIAVYVESTPEETESRLLRQLRKRLPELPPELGLAEIAEWIRRSEGSKVVLILDQFEQWLHSHRIDVDGELLRALRQCDGGRLQSILMIRDDFYLAAVRLMNQVDVPIVTDQNFKLVDLFDKEHARRVLIRFGEYYERLPPDASQHTFEQQAFLRGVVDGLSENNHIVPVRLSLLAELLKGRDWVPSTLEVIGGLDGLGISFLEETFASSRADARHRVHQEAARGILRRLLPEVGADIKGSMRSEEELLEASGYANRRQDFQDLMRILDGELRMLTPTHPEGQETQARTGAPSYRYFQLTHDYLVPSLREWLTRKQRESKKGRAELRLAERAGAWSTNPETKQLPTLWEWLSIWRLTESSKWRAEEKALMSRANRYHMQRNGFGALMLALLIFAGVTLEQWYSARELDREADNMVAKIETADFSRLADELPNVIPLKSIIKPKLQGALDKARPESLERLKLSLAMLIVDPRQVDSLVHYLTTADTSYVRLLIDQLRPYKEEILDFLWDSVEGYDAKNCLPVASALADYNASNNRWREIAGKVSEKMVTENPLRLPTWIELLRPVATHLNPELARIHLATPDSVRSQSQIDLATEILGTFAAKDFDALHELILTREPNQFAKLFPYYEAFRKQATERLRLELARRIEADESTTPYA
ncbi:MAG: serine/threonine protein kinase, partial [Pirellula sp.]